ncbi:MAG: HNH endonuclease [Desulfobacterales bacterium]|nr:HNH endonuclease [Desulfobacterales bacterium]
MAKRKKRPDPFAFHQASEDLGREKRKARDLRNTQWWKRQCDRGRCHYCGRPTPPGELTMDHIVPLARGGLSTRGNVVPCCKDCNTNKKQLLPMEWERYLTGFKQEDGPAGE